MLNRVVLVGRLTRDPELRYTPNGVAVANFTVAVNRPFSNQQGNREADFYQLCCMAQSCRKFSKLYEKREACGCRWPNSDPQF